MSESSNNTGETQTQSGDSDLVKELNRFGENLGKLLKAAWESDERKSMEREMRSGLDQVNKQINKAVDQARADLNVKKARENVKGVWETAHGPQVLNEMQKGLVDSLRRLNDEIARRAESKPAQEVKADAPPPPPDEVQPE